jgi:hypothetical protein
VKQVVFDRVQEMQEEYRRQQVDLNIYGLKTSVKNPMNRSNWNWSAVH